MKINNQESLILEACVDSLDSAISAVHRGAHRLELCADLHLDGTTPSADLIRSVLNVVEVPVKVMIRPRGGDFVYSDTEFQQMLDTIEDVKRLGVYGIVTGILNEDNTLDMDRIALLAQTTVPLPMTVHKCIDLVPDIFQAIEDLEAIPGVLSILSSGQAATAWEGRKTLKQMQIVCGHRFSLIVAGKVTPANLMSLAEITGAMEYHGRWLP